MAGTAEDTVRLGAFKTRAEAFREADDTLCPPLATAKGAVPLLWLALFEYDDTDVHRVSGIDAFGAVVSWETALLRLRALLEHLPHQPSSLRGSVLILQRALEKARMTKRPQVALFPLELFARLKPPDRQAYLKQLTNLCDLWTGVRGGLSWPDALKELERLSGNISSVLDHEDQRVPCYALIGSLAERWGALDESVLVREGQAEEDMDPEAIAVGEQGLALGRFNGVWKLMSSGTSEDLRSTWGEAGVVWAVGRSGTTVRLEKGLFSPVKTPTTAHLHMVTGMDASTIFAAGDEGTLLVWDRAEWQPWPLPTKATLRAIWAGGQDRMYVAGDEPAIFRFDGYAWQRMPLPAEGVGAAFGSWKDKVVAAGGSQRGGELFVLEREGWIADSQLPRVEWLEGLWNGWGEEIGIIPHAGEALVNEGNGWTKKPLPVDQVTSVASGTQVMATGRLGKHTVIVARSEGRWEIEAALTGLTLNGIWVAGRPKPPRLRVEPSTSKPDGA
jgi:hypothetical protein